MINFSSRIPSAYQEVEYIQTTGTQYINTGFVPDQDSRAIVDVELVSTSSSTAIFGSRTGNGTAENSLALWNVSGILRFDYDEQVNSTGIAVGGRHFVDINKNVAIIDNQTFTATYGTFSSVYNFLLGTCVNGGVADNRMSSGKWYSCKLYDNGTLIRDLVPCYRKADNVAGMYDLVNRVFYTNAGTGSFTVGANVGDGSIEITRGSFIPKHFALRRRMMAIVAPAGFEWVGWANATWEDIYNLCKAKQEGKIDAWPDDVVLGATKITTLSTAILGTSTFTMRIIGLDIDGEGVITFDSQYHTAQVMTISSLNTYQNNFYNYCNAKPYIKPLRKGTAAYSTSRNGAVTYADYYVWSLSEREVNLDEYSNISVANSTTTKAECTYGVNQPYPYFTSDDKRKKTAAGSSTGYAWLTRSTYAFPLITTAQPVIITVQGSSNNTSRNATNIRFSPCFAIG